MPARTKNEIERALNHRLLAPNEMTLARAPSPRTLALPRQALRLISNPSVRQPRTKGRRTRREYIKRHSELQITNCNLIPRAPVLVRRGVFPQGRGRNLSLVRRQFGDGSLSLSLSLPSSRREPPFHAHEIRSNRYSTLSYIAKLQVPAKLDHDSIPRSLLL